MQDKEVIQITEDDMKKAQEQGVVVVRDLDLVGQTDSTTKPGSNWTPNTTLVSKEAVDVMLLIDTSGSMGANDYKPNRLAAAIEAAQMFTQRKVTQNYNDRVGVIGFGGGASLAHPLDSDLDKVAASIAKLSITHSGTMIGTALHAAQNELARHKGKKRAIVLLSDGGDDYDTSQPVKVAASLGGIKVFTIGIGTEAGGMAKLPHGQQKVYLNAQLLRQIAAATGGKYLYAPDVPQLQKIYLELADY